MFHIGFHTQAGGVDSEALQTQEPDDVGVKELTAVGRSLEIDAAQRTASFQSLAQACAFRRGSIGDGFQFARNDFHCCADSGVAVILGSDDNFRVRALSVETFGQEFQTGAFSRCRHICADNVGFGHFRRVGIGVADFRCGRFGFEHNFARQRIDGVVRVFGQWAVAV